MFVYGQFQRFIENEDHYDFVLEHINLSGYFGIHDTLKLWGLRKDVKVNVKLTVKCNTT